MVAFLRNWFQNTRPVLRLLHTLRRLRYKHNQQWLRWWQKTSQFPSRYPIAIATRSWPISTLSATVLGGILLLSVNDDLPVKHCSQKDSDETVKLCLAAKLNDVTSIKRLVQEGIDVNQRHPLGWSPLQVAAANGCLESVKVLIEAGADVDAGDFYSTPYRVSHQKGLNSHTVIATREREFSSNIRSSCDCRGFTALHYAVVFHHMQIIQLLVDAAYTDACVRFCWLQGAMPNINNQAGHAPVDYSDDDQITALLKDTQVQYSKLKEKQAAIERKRYPLEKRLKEHIIGQELPIAAVASAIRRKENGWHNEDRPMVFLFLGSSGIGKTELAKQVARYMHKDIHKGFIRLDMSEYQEKHEVSKMIGSPPGYIGHEEGGQLTKRLKQCPNAVVLLDEIDKAHPDLLTVLLQLFDEGRLTDGKGITIECKDAIFIMTSNLANAEIADHAVELRKKAKLLALERNKSEIELSELEEKITLSKGFCDRVVRPILKNHFRRDEFLGRINEMLYFLPFSRSELLQLAEKELNYWTSTAKDRHNIRLTWETEVLEAIADGFDIYYGARSIKYEVEKRIINQLAAAHERELIWPDCDVHITALHDEEKGDQKISIEIIKDGNKKEPIKLDNFDTNKYIASSF